MNEDLQNSENNNVLDQGVSAVDQAADSETSSVYPEDPVLSDFSEDPMADYSADEMNEDYIWESFTPFSAVRSSSNANANSNSDSSNAEPLTDVTFNVAILFVFSMILGILIFNMLSKKWHSQEDYGITGF